MNSAVSRKPGMYVSMCPGPWEIFSSKSEFRVNNRIGASEPMLHNLGIQTA